MVARAYTVAFEGVEARHVEVQCAVLPGVPGFSVVGLPDKAVSEARERVRAALSALAIALPSRRISVNLSPADLPKEGSHFDLPIALALLAALEIIPADAAEGTTALVNCHSTARSYPWSVRCPRRWPPPPRTGCCSARAPPGQRRPGWTQRR